jgi:hypothetical protein
LFGDHVVFIFLLHRRGLNSKPGGECIAATGAFSSISLLLTTYGRLKDYLQLSCTKIVGRQNKHCCESTNSGSGSMTNTNKHKKNVTKERGRRWKNDFEALMLDTEFGCEVYVRGQ